MPELGKIGYFVCLGLMLVGHIWALRACWQRIRLMQIPSSIDCSILSCVAYYDVGLVYNTFVSDGYRGIFVPLHQRFDERAILTLIIIGSYPLLMRACERVMGEPAEMPLRSSTASQPRWLPGTTLFLVLISAGLAAYAVDSLSNAPSVWAARRRIGDALGIYILVLYIPLSLLAYFSTVKASRTTKGAIALVILALLAAVTCLPIGQRTMLLLPFVLILLFHVRPTALRMGTGLAIVILVAAIVLPLFKWQFASTTLGVTQLISSVIQTDVSRSETLITVVDSSELVGTKVLPYPMAGYVYSLLFYVPRSVAPFKGRSTAQYFTAYVYEAGSEDMDWGIGIGVLEEALLNGGWLLSPFIILGYGLFFAFCDRYRSAYAYLTPPVQMSALFLCGTHLPALLLIFGFMFVVCLSCHLLLVGRRKRDRLNWPYRWGSSGASGVTSEGLALSAGGRRSA